MKSHRRLKFLLLVALAPAMSLRAAVAPTDTEVTSENFEMHETAAETVSIFTGNVVLKGTNLNLTCDRLEIVTVPLSDKSSSPGASKKTLFKTIVAAGKVRILQIDENREATCGHAEILPNEDKITLTDRPMVVDRDEKGVATTTWIGDELVLMPGEVKGKNVHIIGPPIKDLGFDLPKTAPAAAGATKAAPPPAAAAPKK